MHKALALYSFIPFLYMKKDKPFSQNSIISRIIQKRVKLAKKMHDKVVISMYSNIQKNNSISSSSESISSQNTKEVMGMMPSRKTWIHLWKSERTKKVLMSNSSNKYILLPRDSVSKNKERIRLTIERDLINGKEFSYLKKLLSFVTEIQSNIRKNIINITPPEIIPKIKDSETIRPLCVFSLRDNVLLQETNSFLIRYYDRYFQNCSYAFRGKRIINGILKVPTHHDTIDKIIEFKNKHKNEIVYVAECDLKKFFDTINHEIILTKLKKLLRKNLFMIPYWRKRIIHIFEEYLNCYDFRKNIYELNSNQDFLRNFHCQNHEFKWIKDTELQKFYSSSFESVKLGVPQGGALSGFIANLVLDEVDVALTKLNDPDFLYLRYCDDMIMLHTDKSKIMKYQNRYMDIIKNNYLFVHEPTRINCYDKHFYSSKSKLPYAWGGDLKNNQIPWISFVGYQIGFNGEIRVRKSSINKEIEKQNKMVRDTLLQVNGMPNNPNRIIRSIILRLQGMSVGYINLYHPDTRQSLCWTNGFNKLNDNVFSRRQMRKLDRNRCKQINILCHKLEAKSEKKDFPSNKNSGGDHIDPKIQYSGKPFSYFGWLINKDGDKE